jgi:hypothetical protein
MKKFILLLMAIAMVAVAVPAMAQVEDCNLAFDVSVFKTVTVTKNVTIDKFFDFNVQAYIFPDAFAECEVYKCDFNSVNYLLSWTGLYTDDITNSFNGFIGIGQANQAAGYMNNQGNIVAAAVVTNVLETAAMLESAVEQTNYLNLLTTDFDISLATITDSFNDFTGIGQANQSPGHMNNQNNVVAISAGIGIVGVVASNETYLSQSNTLGVVDANFALNTNTVSGSFSGFTGIGQVNQSAGSLNNQANVVTVSYVGASPF